jgi:hypothetical protein
LCRSKRESPWDAVLDALRITAAEVAFEGDALDRMIVHRAKRAGGDAFPASDADGLVDFERLAGAGGTSLQAEHLAAVQTRDGVMHTPFFDLDNSYPGKGGLKSPFVLERAREFANPAARAFAGIREDYFSFHAVSSLR